MTEPIEHEWSPGNPRCLHCGTLAEHHARTAQTCVPRRGQAELHLRPEPVRRVYASEDWDTINVRLNELRAASAEALNRIDPIGADG